MYGRYTDRWRYPSGFDRELELDSRVRDVMFCEFAYIDENDLNIVSHIHELAINISN